MNRLEKRIKGLEKAVENLRWDDLHTYRREETLCKGLLHMVACAAIGHTFKLTSAFINKENNNCRYGKFECTNCGLGIERPLTIKEENAAKELGMPV